MYKEGGINPFPGWENKDSERLRDFLKVNKLSDEVRIWIVSEFHIYSFSALQWCLSLTVIIMSKFILLQCIEAEKLPPS